MSEPSRTRADKAESKRRRRQWRSEGLQQLERKDLLAPYLTSTVKNATFTPFATQPTSQNLGTIAVTVGPDSAFSAAAYTSVSQLTGIQAFNNEIVRIEAGPGGDFGKSLFAITRGNNSAGPPVTTGGRPGVIYRVDPTTGQVSPFFDLNTVANQSVPGSNAGNSAGSETGLVNWYDLSFDVDGYFDGLPSLFVSTVDRTDPTKNAIYRIGTDGSFLGLFVSYTDGLADGTLTQKPSAIIVPPSDRQNFLRGLVAGNGSNNASFAGLFFDANGYQPGQSITGGNLPDSVSSTNLIFGPAVGLASTNRNYASEVYAAFTDFGQPGIPGFSPAQPGLSGLQGILGDLLIQNNTGTGLAGTNFGQPGNIILTGQAGDNDIVLGSLQADGTNPSGIDAFSAIQTTFRRFQDTAFDKYGFFSYGTTVTPNAGATPTVGAPAFAGSLFVSDLGTGLAVPVVFPADFGTGTAVLPVQGPGVGGLVVDPDDPTSLLIDFPDSNLGGRVIRVLPDGTVTPFAEGFNTSGVLGSGSFIESSLSLTFSSDGTTLYVADNDGIWQFKSTLALATSTSGSLIGLNDLRTLATPFDGQDTAVAVVDTGIDAATPQLRNRVSEGRNVITNGPGNDDLAPGNGHGTGLAGVVAQFVPQATLVPVNVFSPLLITPATTNQAVFEGFKYVADNPFVVDPTTPGKVDRIVTSVAGFGTTETYDTEGTAFRLFPQIVLSFKGQLTRLRRLGITQVAAAGQNGVEYNGTPVANAGTTQGISLPGVLNEVVSVSGVSPFPYTTRPNNPPTDPPTGPLGRNRGPVTVVGNDPGTNPPFAAGDNLLFQDKILAASNRNFTLDFMAPALDVPTFRRTFAGDGNINNVFTEAGTSLSAGIVAGSFTYLASALDFYIELAQKGFTVSGYLNTPVDTLQLNYGANVLRNFEAYNNPDGINSILQWTAVPVTDSDIAGANVGGVPQPPNSLAKPSQFRDFSRIDLGNAVAAIEGSIALPYLINTGAMAIIDSNGNGFVTAQEIQNFVDRSSTIGLAEAGSLARLLGGTDAANGINDTSGPTEFVSAIVGGPINPQGFTSQGEQPDQPDALLRRFTFFDFAADGKVDGVVSMDQWNVMARTLLPPPDSNVIVDRQRGSTSGYLLDGTPVRNQADLQHLLGSYAFAPLRRVRRAINPFNSPNKFGVNRGVPALNQSPVYTLFDRSETTPKPATSRQTAAARRAAAQATPKTTATAANKATTPAESTPAKKVTNPAADAVDELLARNGLGGLKGLS